MQSQTLYKEQLWSQIFWCPSLPHLAQPAIVFFASKLVSAYKTDVASLVYRTTSVSTFPCSFWILLPHRPNRCGGAGQELANKLVWALCAVTAGALSTEWFAQHIATKQSCCSGSAHSSVHFQVENVHTVCTVLTNGISLSLALCVSALIVRRVCWRRLEVDLLVTSVKKAVMCRMPCQQRVWGGKLDRDVGGMDPVA